ncbi:hypothetical protein GF406_01120, partial [candidate division KSB1 bacterium]|nr:hypothetical protein [candidate division KSB1 bacterium]
MSQPIEEMIHSAVLSDLVADLNRGRLLIIAGAGLSIPCGLPDWRKLVMQIMPDHLAGYNIQKDADLMRQMENHLLNAAQIWWDAVPTEEARMKFFRDNFNPDDLEIGKNHELLAKLPLKAVLTTNYDPLFEKAQSVWATNCKTHLAVGLGLLFNSNQPFLLKLHGTWNEPESIVLTTEQYARLKSNQAYSHLYQSIQLHYRLLFLGYGGADPDLEFMHQEMARYYSGKLPHRILVLNNPTEKLKTIVMQDKNALLVEYDGDRDGHGIITDLLQYLIDHVEEKKPETRRPSKPDAIRQYWKRIIAHPDYNSIPVVGQSEQRSIDGLYIRLKLTAQGQKTHVNKKLAEWLEKDKHRELSWSDSLAPDRSLSLFPRSIILGPPGMGKTTLLRYLMFTLARVGLKSVKKDEFHWKGVPAPIPVFLPLPEIARQDADLLTCMRRYLAKEFT